MTDSTRDRDQDLPPSHLLREGADEVVEEVVGILTRLTSEVERFDSIILERRSLLEHRNGQPGRDDAIDRESSLLRQAAADLATRTQRALEQLRQLAELGRPRRLRSPQRGRARGFARDRRTLT